MPRKKCIVSFAANGREPYCKGLLRLIKSCKEAGWDGDFLMRTLDGYVDRYEGVDIINGSYPVTERYGLCNNHAEVPFGFKPAIILEAIEKGYEQIIWCDSSIVMNKDISPLLEIASQRGVVAFNNLGFPLLNWVTDLQQERTGITNEELWEAKQIMACAIIFDVSVSAGKEIFKKWLLASRDGVSFQNGYGSKRIGFINTRWDQSVLSILLHQYKIELQPYGELCYPPYDTTFEYGENIYFVNKQID